MKIVYMNVSLIFLLISQLSFSQQMPIDFSDSSDNFTAFSGSGFSFNTDPDDAGNDVGQFFNDGSNAWQGFALDLIRAVDLDFQQTISLSFYGFDPNTHTIVLKLENGANPDVEVTQNVPSGGGWTHNITFDFSNAVLSSDGVTPVNATGTYDRLVIFIDGGVTTPGTYLLDTIDDGSVGTDPNAIDVEYTYLVWEDEFDTPGVVDPTKWHHQTQVIIPGVGWANGEAQHYTDRIDNSFVDTSGFLNIVAKSETYTDQGLTKNYTSARLNSKFAFTYGRVDIRAKLPLEPGTWPAIWMLGKNINEDGAFFDSSFGTTSWPACGEIDIMEHGIFPSEDINYINSALHTTCCHGGNPNQGGILANDLANQFHVYSINWSPDQITFLLDGVGFYTYNPAVKNVSTWPFFEDQFILLNVAMGGLAGNVNSGFTQSAMLIDYVKVYQLDPLSVEDAFSLDTTISVYPNPANDTVYITAKVALNSLALYDVYGNLILRKEKDMSSIDVSNLKSGVYFLEMYANNEKVVKKVIVN